MVEPHTVEKAHRALEALRDSEEGLPRDVTFTGCSTKDYERFRMEWRVNGETEDEDDDDLPEGWTDYFPEDLPPKDVEVDLMKVIEFTDENKRRILAGEKDITIRFRMFHNEGDAVVLVDEDGEPFAFAGIADVERAYVSDLPDADFDGHVNYDTAQDARDSLSEYYPDIEMDSMVKLVHLDILVTWGDDDE